MDGGRDVLDWVFLTPLRRYSEVGLLAFRLFIGGFLLLSVWSDISQPDAMTGFAAFLARNNFPVPEVMAQLSVWAQFSVGLAFLMGLFTRWAGVVCAINFTVAFAMVDRLGGVRASFSSGLLAMAGLYLALHGAGPFGLDSMFEAPKEERDLKTA